MASRMEAFSDAEIIKNLQQQRQVDDTIRFLYRAHFELLAHYVADNRGSRADAGDVFQETLIAFVQSVQAGKFRGESSIRTFLYALNRNIWLNELKRRGRAEQRELKYEQAQDQETPDAGNLLELRESREALMQLIGSLGDACKKILVAYYYERQSMKEILENLPYENEQVVRNKKYKCLKTLEKMLAANETLYHQLKSWLHG